MIPSRWLRLISWNGSSSCSRCTCAGVRCIPRHIAIFCHRPGTARILALVILPAMIRVGLHLLTICHDDAIIMLSMLQIILCHDDIASGQGIARQRYIFFGDMRWCPTDFDIWSIGLVTARERILHLAATVIVWPSAPSAVLLSLPHRLPFSNEIDPLDARPHPHRRKQPRPLEKTCVSLAKIEIRPSAVLQSDKL